MSLKNLDDTRRTDVVLEHRYDHGMVWFWECRNVDQLVTTYDHISNENIKILKKKYYFWYKSHISECSSMMKILS